MRTKQLLQLGHALHHLHHVQLVMIETAVDKYKQGRVVGVLLLSKWHTAAFDHYEKC